MAVRFALRHPDRVRGLVLLTPAGATVDPGGLARVKARLDVRTNAAARELLDLMLIRPAWWGPLAAPYLRETYSRPSIMGLVSSVSARDMLTATELGQLGTPILLLWGCQDRLLPRSDLEHFRASLPRHAEVVEVEGLGHGAVLDRPVQVARRIIDFARRDANKALSSGR